MKIRSLLAVASVVGVCAVVQAENFAEKPIFNHIVSPREAIDLGSTNEWKSATVKKGTAWDDATIKWSTTTVPSSRWWQGIGSKDPNAQSHLYYRRTFKLTPEQAKKAGSIFFEFISPHYEIRLNGKVVSAEEKVVSMQPQLIDVSGFLREGDNELEISLFRNSTPGHLVPATSFGWQEGPYGISRPIHLELFDQISIDDLSVITKVAPTKVWTALVSVTNRTAKDEKVLVSAVIEECDNLKAMRSVVIPANSAKKVELSFECPNIKLWNPDTPNLYYAKFEVKGGSLGTSTPTNCGVLDAVRQRFGFREFGWSGRQLTLNGSPLLLRRESISFGSGRYDVDKARETVAELKRKGYNSARCDTKYLYRDVRIADEEGYILTPLPFTGGPYRREAPYWPLCSNIVQKLVITFKNHPSISHWSLFNEFGPKFGVPLDQSPKTAAIGEFAMSLDPTRFWVSTGDYEMSAEGMQSTGPTKLRSLHYPINLSWGSVPDVAYWLANDGDYGSWGVDYKKPVGLSEDLYHGMNDNPTVMGQWGNDAIYTPEGYCAAWRKVMEYFCDGYYYSGVSEWNPWATDTMGKYNWLYRDGPLMPDFHISRRHAFPNIESNEKFSDKLFVFNQTFTVKKCSLEREDFFNDKSVLKETKELTLKPGELETLELAFIAPKIKAGKLSGRYSANFKLVDGSKTLAKRTFSFNVLPQAEKFGRNVFLIDYTPTNSPVRTLFEEKNIFTNATSALAKATKKTTLLVTGAVTGEDGKALDKWVFAGGSATLLLGNSIGWSPVEMHEKKFHNFAWRRTAGFLGHEDESLWSVWRPSGRLSEKALVKETTLDIDVLLDHCISGGFINADILRVWRNCGGSWLVTSLPIEERFNDEIASRYLLSRLVADQAEENDLDRNRGFAFVPKNHPYAPIFKQNSFPEPEKIPAKIGDKSPVLIVDGQHKLSEKAQANILSYARSGGTILVTEASETNRAFLARLGLGIHTRGALYSFSQTKYAWHWTTPFGWRGIVKEPYYKPEVISGKEAFTEEQLNLICEKLENKGQIGIEGECPTNRPFLNRKRIEWREANMDWFTRVGSPRVLNGISNSDLYFSKLSLDSYNCYMMRKNPEATEANQDMYNQIPEAISTGSLFQLTGDKEEKRGIKEVLPPREKAAKDAVFCTYPAILAEVSFGKGKVYVLTLDSANFRGKYPQKFMRLYRQLLGNLGVKTSTQTELVRYQTTGGVPMAQYQLWDNKKYDKPAKVLFENGEDLRYFPVNQRGWSLASGNECPVEPFPKEQIILGGIPFKIPEPNFRNGASVNVDPGGYGVTLYTPAKDYRARKIWILAALDKEPTDPKVLSGEKSALNFVWFYSDAEGKRVSKGVNAYYGKEIGSYMKPIAPTGNGRIAWEGHTGTGKPAVLYAFSIDNPHDINVPLTGVHCTTCGKGVKTAILAITWEPL